MSFKFLLIFLSLSTAFAAPSLEGLFRNGDNPEVALGNTATVTYKMDLIHNNEQFEQTEDQNTLINTVFVRNMYYMDENGRVELYQTVSTKSDFKIESLVSIKYINRFDDFFKRDQQMIRSTFQALTSSFVLNRSQEVAHLLTTYGKSFKTNRDVRNTNKIALYDSYKKYLGQDKATQSAEDSPLRPSDPEKRSEVQALLRESFYENSNHVSLVRDAGKFYWGYDLETVSGRFGNEDGRFKKMDIGYAGQKVSIVADDFVSFDGSYQLPRQMNMVIDEQQISVGYISMRVSTPKEKGLSQLVQKAQEAFDKVNRSVPVNVAPQLLQLIY